MIAKLIDLCLRNRGMVLLLTVLLVGAGVWAAQHIAIDAIPDLSDVQVILRTDDPGQAPRIVEDQVTYPLTTAMLAVPHAKTVRGYSLFGTSFVYIIFDDGTDPYWARSRVLEQLSSVASRLPAGVSPQLGPDATGVGWVYEYALTTGRYCPDHPNGAWQDPQDKKWYASPADAPDDAVRARLVHHRVFDDSMKHCPLDGRALEKPDVTLADLRSLQDWYLRYELTAVDGVSEVAAVGGFVRQYQVVVDPVKLLAYNLPLAKVKMAIQRSNNDVGGRLIEMSETEYMVRGRGYLGSAPSDAADSDEKRSQLVIDQLSKTALGATQDGTPIHLGDVAQVRLGPDIRRGVAEWDGLGETVGGIVVMRYGENARATIRRVRAKLETLEKGLPPGVAIHAAYDRSDLIDRSVDTLTRTLIEEIAMVTIVTLIFLLHARSALVAVFVLPTGVLASVLAMHLMGINANIMSLGGIALAIGVMVDSSIVMVENAHKHFEAEAARVAGGAPPRPRSAIIAEAAKEVGPSLFFALLIITVSFLPVFVLGEQSGRMFKPLAWTKTFSMAAGAVLAVTIIPVLMLYLIHERLLPRRWPTWARWITYLGVILIPAAIVAIVPLGGAASYRWWIVGSWVILAATVVLPQRIVPEDRLWLSRILIAVFRPLFAITLRLWPVTIVVAVLAVASMVYPWSQLGSEFMPPLEEGDLLYMPTTDPGVSLTKAKQILEQTDRMIKQAPEVASVFGKIGRAETATDPAPPSMLETTITLKRDKSQWRKIAVPRFFDGWPHWLRDPLAKMWPTRRTITTHELVYGYKIIGKNGKEVHVPGLNDMMQIPGLTNAWTMPIKTRIDMLSTGIRTPIGIKVMGPDLAKLASIANDVALALRSDESTAKYTTSAFPEKSVGGNYLDIDINRDEIARYGLSVGDVQDVIMSAVGGMNVSYTVEGRERYPINLRYPRELRDNLPALKQTLVATPSGAQIPLTQLASFHIHKGAPMIKSENAQLTSWVYVDISGIDLGTYVSDAQQAVAKRVHLPAGYTLIWSGQYEYMQQARQRLLVVIPITGALIVLLLYLSTLSWLRVMLVILMIPLSLVGSFWLLWALAYNMSIAVWVGLIAMAGLEVSAGLVMLVYLDLSFEQRVRDGLMRTPRDLWQAVYEGAVLRVRPKTMTVATAFFGLLPLLWGHGAGADTMRRLAAPMIGGIGVGYLATLLILPTFYYLARRAQLAIHRKPEVILDAEPAPSSR